MSEFKLSDKLTFGDTNYNEPFIHKSDIKEFIRLLKEKLDFICFDIGNEEYNIEQYVCNVKDILEEIDNLAGDLK